jgi:hypothetical protein
MQILQDASSIQTVLATQAELARLITIHVEVLSEYQWEKRGQVHLPVHAPCNAVNKNPASHKEGNNRGQTTFPGRLSGFTEAIRSLSLWPNISGPNISVTSNRLHRASCRQLARETVRS